ncbi:hypothetical protein [Planktothrix rubescens]|uniref:hypothetical protein n=1 Tax=Planktothrix rubescens TaxID=59512 RepID=UPI0004077215|nr:hypothetical protein [Planktothrix rubescens]
MSYAYNSEEFDFNSEDDFILNFENGEIINELEMIVMEIVEMILGDRFRYCPQVPFHYHIRYNLYQKFKLIQFI